MKLEKVLLVYQFRNCDAHKIAKKVLKQNSVNYKSINRTRMKTGKNEGVDLVIAIGGDGTFLRTSHFIKDSTPILGMNANPKKKVGFFLRCSAHDFETKLKKILRNKHKLLKLSRLKCELNKKVLP